MVAEGAKRGALANAIFAGTACTRTGSRSLRVNLTPAGERICNLDCTYCPFPRVDRAAGWPHPGCVGAMVSNALHHAPEVESITIAGPGEPTLHPRFGWALAEVLSARRGRPELPVRVVTNAARVLDPRVRRLLAFADECVVRLDAGGDRIERPGQPIDEPSLRTALDELVGFSVEAVFVEGRAANTGETDVVEWIGRIARLRPRRVLVTTIEVDPGHEGLRPASRERLERIAGQLRLRSDAEVGVLP